MSHWLHSRNRKKGPPDKKIAPHQIADKPLPAFSRSIFACACTTLQLSNTSLHRIWLCCSKCPRNSKRLVAHHGLLSRLTRTAKLLGFIANENPQIRLLAVEHLVPYSTTQPSIFKSNQLQPVKHLKFLVRDHPASGFRCGYNST